MSIPNYMHAENVGPGVKQYGQYVHPLSLDVFFGHEREHSRFAFGTEEERRAFIEGLCAAEGWTTFRTTSAGDDFIVETRVGVYWENTWHEDDEPQIFDSYDEAAKALTEFLEDTDSAGLDYDP